MMTLQNWHYSIFEKFGELVYGKTLTNNNFYDDGRVHQQKCLFKINQYTGDYDEESFPTCPDNLYFFKLVKGNEFFLLPKKHLLSLPCLPKETINIKMKKSDSQVWKYITDLNSYSTPPIKSKSCKKFIDEWNPIQHSNPTSQTALKLIAFSRGIKCGICGFTSLGKNSDKTLKRHIYGKTSPKIKAPTKAKLYTELYYNEDCNFDEITSWKREEVNIVEDIMAEFGDESPDMTKFSKDSNRLMECIKNIVERSLTFTFNPYSADNKFFIEDKFRNWDKISDRYPILFLDGKVVGHYPRPSSAEREAIVMSNLPILKEIACNSTYFWNNMGKEVHNYDRSKITLKGRHLSNLSPLFVTADAYSETQEEFDFWVSFIQNAIKEYNMKYAKNCLANQTKVKDDGQMEFAEPDITEERI